MKKIFLLTVVTTLVTFTGCKKCKTCTSYFLGEKKEESEICDEDLEELERQENLYDATWQTGVQCE